MNEWLIGQGLASPQVALWAGLLLGLLAGVLLAWFASRRATHSEQSRLQHPLEAQEAKLA